MNVKHNYSSLSHPRRGLYMSWQNMRDRCSNKRFRSNYAGRGITIDPRWESFLKFLADIGASWFPGAELHRTDKLGDYEMTNCVWLTKIQHRRLHTTRGLKYKHSAAWLAAHQDVAA